MAFKKKKKKGEDAPEGEEAEAKEAAAPAPEGEATTEGAEGAEGEGAPRKGKKKLILIIVGVLVLAGIGGGAFMMLHHKKKAGDETAGADKAATGDQAAIAKPVYYELPEFLVNLNTASNGKASFIKMSVTLELKDQASVAVLDANKPRIIDTFNTYLHELRPEDVQGSAGIYRLRQELMARINGTVQEGLVKDILFSEIIIQ